MVAATGDAERRADSHFGSCFCKVDLQPPKDQLVGQVVLKTAESSLENEAREWATRHFKIEHDHVENLGKVETDRNLCYEAEACVHTGAGLRFASFSAKIMVCHRIAEKHLTKKVFDKHMTEGDFVVRFSWKAAHVEAEPVDSDLEDDWHDGNYELEEYMHIGLMYEKPWRPTYLRMMREPARDTLTECGVAPRRCELTDIADEAVKYSAPDFKTLWESIMQHLGGLPDDIRMEWYFLVADFDRPVATIRPYQQLIARDAIIGMEVWKATMPKSLRPRKRKPHAGRGRGRARAGAKGRGRGRSAAGKSPDDLPGDGAGPLRQGQNQFLLR